MQDLDVSTIKLLLVDDEAHCTKLMEAFLRQAGFSRMTMTNDSRQALELFHQTVSMKSVGNLTDFVRSHMLEPFEVAPRIQALIGHFDDLDRAHRAVLKAQQQVELLTPLVKAYSSDQSFRICETAIQTLGGAGYISDYGIEQYCRDAKIFSIYEGTNHIQAMDLVGRKLMQRGGANVQAFGKDVGTFVATHRDHATLKDAIGALAHAMEALTGTGGSLGCSASRTLAASATGTTASMKYLRLAQVVSACWTISSSNGLTPSMRLPSTDSTPALPREGSGWS